MRKARKGFVMKRAKDCLEQMIPLLNETPKAVRIMKAWPKKVQFDLDNEESPFCISVEGGEMHLLEGAWGEPDIIVNGDGKALADVVEGVMDITHPISQGRLGIKRGKISEMTHFNRILALAKRG